MKIIAILSIVAAALASGCRSTYNARTGPPRSLGKEGSCVVVRPDVYRLFGTRSVRDYLEIVYEEFAVNEANQPVVRLGIRNRGGRHFHDLTGPDFTLYAQAVFYTQPVAGTTVRSAPVYRTNRQPVPMPKGETSDLVFASPVAADGYQIIISEK